MIGDQCPVLVGLTDDHYTSSIVLVGFIGLSLFELLLYKKIKFDYLHVLQKSLFQERRRERETERARKREAERDRSREKERERDRERQRESDCQTD